MSKTPFWERSYARPGGPGTFGGGRPGWDLVEVVDRLLVGTEARVLDLGCGYGRSAIYAAERGLAVTGDDVPRAAIAVSRSSF